MTIHHSDSEAQTGQIAALLAAETKPNAAIALHGPLGAGKSAFARAFIRSLCGADIDVPSPTFTLVQTYDYSDVAIWHFDLYRLSDPDDLFELGWEDSSSGIRLIEWPEKAAVHMPRGLRAVTISPTGPTSRRIEIDD